MKPRARRPSPALVVASLALFVALGGTGIAAHLAVRSSDIVNDTIRSEDVVDDSRFSLGGSDIREKSLRGLVKGRGSLYSKRRVLGEGDESAVLISLPGLGRLLAACSAGSNTGSQMSFKNTSNATVRVMNSSFTGFGSGTGSSELAPSAIAALPYATETRTSTWSIGRGVGQSARAATIVVADRWDDPACVFQANALSDR